MKRFIAGAQCPSCKQEETLYYDMDNTEPYQSVYCQQCAYQAKRDKVIRETEAGDTEEKQITWH